MSQQRMISIYYVFVYWFMTLVNLIFARYKGILTLCWEIDNYWADLR